MTRRGYIASPGSPCVMRRVPASAEYGLSTCSICARSAGRITEKISMPRTSSSTIASTSSRSDRGAPAAATWDGLPLLVRCAPAARGRSWSEGGGGGWVPRGAAVAAAPPTP
jgi:hypothetical protein